MKEAWIGELQAYERINLEIREAFIRHMKARKAKPGDMRLSWSNWGFGREPLELSCKRLSDHGVAYIELHGNHYGPDLGYAPAQTRRILSDHGLSCSGVCGMFSAESDLSSPHPASRQAAIDYIRREVAFTAEMGGAYLLVCPAAVGRPKAWDQDELSRSVESLSRIAHVFVEHNVRAAIEPIRSAETSLCHTVAEANAYIDLLGHPGVRHINGDVFHMLSEEGHIGKAIAEAGERLINLHMADTNRRALGLGMLDVDTVLRALYLLDYDQSDRFITPEPLGPGGDPYPAQHQMPDPAQMDALVSQTIGCLKARQSAVLSELE